MTKRCGSLILGVLAMLLTVPAAEAKVSPEQARKLGNELTPLGAIRAGNVEGTIPAWEGGITQPPPGYKPGAHHPDPFADDQPLFTIRAANVGQYADKLSPGQVAVFKRYPKTWRMTVYPTRRSAAFPQHVYDRAIANAATAELARGGDGVLNAIGGVPFPIPSNGVEAIWNHIVRYRGETTDQITGQVAPTASGAYTFVRMQQKVLWHYQTQGMTTEALRNRLLYFLQTVMAPARLAGSILLVHEPINQVAEPRKVWTYNTGQRRVRRAPNVAYDNPGTASDGQRTNDQNDMYNSSPDRYNWTLVGRRELYVPYNSYKLHSGDLSYDKIIKPGHINPDLLRYELHRVWVVDARLKKDMRHIYARRTFYIDEDSWQILAVDQYDARGEIWRVSEAHVINYYEVPFLWQTLEVHYDLQNGRYLALGLNNQERPERFNIEMNKRDFTPDALRRRGRR
ncbi:DUF1329 domain-containing protein [Nitrospiraceae bacterium AH_259_D15_M11_P09]|nr:DUF1329 domain-containing protein [Nitrospiraceae bacterium AH_259_D15_M11_P09]